MLDTLIVHNQQAKVVEDYHLMAYQSTQLTFYWLQRVLHLKDLWILDLLQVKVIDHI